MRSKKPDFQPRPKAPPVWLAWALLALSVFVAVTVRLRLAGLPLERDEGEYALAGQLILQGIPPYQLVYNMKMPGIYLAYAGVMSLFGQTPTGIHLGLLLVHLATLAVLFLLARSLFGFSAAAVAVATYTLMTLSPAFVGLAAHATHFVVLPALLGIWVLARIEKTGRWTDCLASGLLFGAAFALKQPGMFFGFFGGLYLLWLQWRNTPIDWKAAALRIGVFSLGCLLPFFGICAWLKLAGVFPQFWFWTISYAREYASIQTWAQGINNFQLTFTTLFKAAPCLWCLAGAGLIALCVGRMPLRLRALLAGLLAFSFLTVCPGFYFRGHYFILFMPAVALLLGWGVAKSEDWLKARPVLRYFPLAVMAAASAQSLYADRLVLFSLPPRAACREIYCNNPFPESIEIARYLEQHTTKDQRILVFGSEPQIYFYAHRHPSTGHIYTYPLMESQPFAKTMQEEMIREIEANPPEYVVFAKISTSWFRHPDSCTLLLEWFRNYSGQQLELEAVFHAAGRYESEAIWDPEAARAADPSDVFIKVFKRKQASESQVFNTGASLGQ